MQLSVNEGGPLRILGSSTPGPSLTQAQLQGGIHFQVSGSNQEEVLYNVIERLPLPEEVDQGLLLVPLRVWLPEAHPAAPSHVSAILSAVMIKMGVYGILRTVSLLGPPAAMETIPPWWGMLLIVVGRIGALLGGAMALYQRDLKRALAYSSIENMGLITLGLGLGLWGWARNLPAVAVFGLAGGVLHVWNHGLMKGLLFLSAGSIAHGTGSRDIEQMGGLLRLMPRTGLPMLLGCVAIAGLPPLNGFIGEWLLYLGLFSAGGVSLGLEGSLSAVQERGGAILVMLLAIGGLALVGNSESL